MIHVQSSAIKHSLDEATILTGFHHPIYTNHSRSNRLRVLLLGVSTAMKTIEIAHTVDNAGTTAIFHTIETPKTFIN